MPDIPAPTPDAWQYLLDDDTGAVVFAGPPAARRVVAVFFNGPDQLANVTLACAAASLRDALAALLPVVDAEIQFLQMMEDDLADLGRLRDAALAALDLTTPAPEDREAA